MNAKLVSMTLLAFVLSLVAGRMMLSPAPETAQATRPAIAVAPETKSAAKTVSTAQAVNEHGATSAPMPMASRGVNREFKNVSNGIVNENTRMCTELSNLYAEGVVHTVPSQFGARVQWRPATQEHRRDGQIVSVNKMDGGARARLDNRGGLQHVVYPATYAETDEHFYVRPEGGIEHDIVLQTPPVTLDPSNGLAYTGFISLSDGLTMWDDRIQITGNYRTRNGIFFKNAFNNKIFYLRAPIAYDSNVTLPGGGMDIDKQAIVENQKHATACEYQISFEESGIKLAVVTPGKWLLSNERAYPVTIDPNFGPFGLADGDPPTYVGQAGTDTLIPAHNSGTKLAIEDSCAAAPDDGYGHVAMPFDFVFYGVNHPAGSLLFVHIDGFASWIPPYPLYDPFTPPHSPCFDNGTPRKSGNTAIPTGAYPNDAMFAYWDDLRFSSDPKSGIYYFIDGAAPSRRLIFEYYKMGYAQGATATDMISFNLILYECNNQIQYTYKYLGEKDRGSSSIGIENPAGSIGVQYCFNAGDLGLPEITEGTSVSFSVSPLSNIKVTSSNTTGCIPLTSCFGATVSTVVPICQQLTGGLSIPPSYGFHWTFQDGGEAFTQNVCHTYTTPGNYAVQLIITDEFGNKATITNALAVTVCDIPPVIMTADPQGGSSPLTVNLTMKSTSPTILIGNTPTQTIIFDNSLTHFLIERLGDQNEPGVTTTFMDIPGSTATVRFDTPGNYIVRGYFSGTSFGLATTGYATLYITVTDPNSFVSNTMVITESDVRIDWKGKATNKNGVLINPNADTIYLKGYLNFGGFGLSKLAGQEMFIALNGYNPIFHGFLDGSGAAVMADPISGTKGTFQVNPDGSFTCSVTGNFAQSLALTNLTEHRLATAGYRLQIGDIFSTPSTNIAYNYVSTISKGANGKYKFGSIVKDAPIAGAPGGFGSPSNQSVLLSGAFLVTSADFILSGDVVNARISGILARAGGDDLRPAATSDVVVKLGNFTEALNFASTPKFKVAGKPPAQKFTFKTAGNTNIQTLGWANKGGAFYITAINMPNALVGIVPSVGVQSLKLQFTVSPDNSQRYVGTTQFDINKVSDTEFKH